LLGQVLKPPEVIFRVRLRQIFRGRRGEHVGSGANQGVHAPGVHTYQVRGSGPRRLRGGGAGSRGSERLRNLRGAGRERQKLVVHPGNVRLLAAGEGRGEDILCGVQCPVSRDQSPVVKRARAIASRSPSR
jgi:hypothetical protein